MNQTAKKLREAAHHMSGNTLTLVQVIRQVREKLDVEETDTFGGDLVAILIAIADELDELQARAAGSSNLRQQLKSAEDKAERRKKHIGYLETALHDKNALLEQRGGTIARLTAENGKLRKQVPSERERQILDMWPKFEDGEYVWFGDRVYELCGKVYGVCLDDDAISLRTAYLDHMPLDFGERVKRLEQEVLDADGVEIEAGDTVWFRSLSTGDRMRKATVTGFGEHSLDGPLATLKDEAGRTWHIDPKKITHVQPDSWERLKEDASKETCFYFGYEDKLCGDGAGCPANKLGNCSKIKAADLIRRAKALAGVGAEE